MQRNHLNDIFEFLLLVPLLFGVKDDQPQVDDEDHDEVDSHHHQNQQRVMFQEPADAREEDLV